MDGATINAKVWAGYAKAAKIIGTPYQHFRPSGVSNPLDPGNAMPDLLVSLNADDPKYARPNVYGKATWYAVADGSQLAVGDYIVGVEGTLFVATLQQMLPIYMVDCNRTISVLRVSMGSVTEGFIGQAGDTSSTEVVLMAGWPASILEGGGGRKNEVDLPTDFRNPSWHVILPSVHGVTLRTSDILLDDLSRKYLISSAELTDMGWRITATQQQA
jgi:hypothetical protein